MRILLVEDDAALGGAIEQALEDATIAVDRSTDGARALAALATTDYDLMLLDLGLPLDHGSTRRLRMVVTP